jgi:hypothetical protein
MLYDVINVYNGMRATDLENLIQRLNTEMFRESFAEDLEKEKAGKWFDEIPGNNRLLRGEPYHLEKPLRDQLKALITNEAGKHQAIGHVMDKETNGAAFPIVLVVGINYYQFSSGLMDDMGIWNDTTMRKNTMAFLNSVDIDLEERFHLVAANLFPWITKTKWQQLELKNGYQEMALLELFGYRNPLLSIRTLAESLEDLKAIIFHGVSSVIPFYAVSFARQWFSANRAPVFLSDNLGLPSRWKNIWPLT